jgi:hypothetical protein
MQKLMVTATFLMLTISTAAIAQSDNSSKGPWPAPVGHRQPRLDQIPPGKDNSTAAQQEKREDAELDRKIKSICRGC